MERRHPQRLEIPLIVHLPFFVLPCSNRQLAVFIAYSTFDLHSTGCALGPICIAVMRACSNRQLAMFIAYLPACSGPQLVVCLPVLLPYPSLSALQQPPAGGVHRLLSVVQAQVRAHGERAGGCLPSCFQVSRFR